MDFSLRTNKYLQIALLFFVFIILGLYFNGNRIKEKMSDMSLSCPNLLRQEGDMIMLYDLTQPGSTTNPAIFHNLAEYAIRKRTTGARNTLSNFRITNPNYRLVYIKYSSNYSFQYK